MFIYDELKSLEIQNRSIKVGLVGAGFMGQGIVEVMESTPGMVVAAIADINIERAAVSFQAVNVTNFKEIKSAGEARSINFSEERVISSNYRVIPEIDCLDFIIEATGVPEIGAEVAYYSIMNGKHIGMMNVETDVTIGYYLNTLAKKIGTVYTVCTGDEPAAIKEIYDFVKTFGFKVIACGKGKNNPLEVSATPLTLEKKAEDSGLNPRMLTEFVDGSKTMVEMSCVANATGLTIDRRNMHGPRTQVDKLTEVFTLKERGGILMNEGVVDYAIGDIAPGVFVVAKHEGALVNKTLQYLKIGEGPDYLFYRPYHLTNIEVPVSVASGYLYKKSSIAASSPPTTEVITIAKKNLERGENIDYIGGFTVYAGLERYDYAAKERLLPFGLCEGAKLTADVEKGKPVTYDQVEIKDTFILGLRKLQDRLYG